MISLEPDYRALLKIIGGATKAERTMPALMGATERQNNRVMRGLGTIDERLALEKGDSIA